MKNKGSSYYYNAFTRLANLALDCALLLKNSDSDSAKKAAGAAAVSLRVRREAANELKNEFLPPLERDDAAALMFELHRLTEAVEAAVRAVYAYGGLAGFEKIAANNYFYVKVLFDAVQSLQNLQKDKRANPLPEQAYTIPAQTAKLIFDMQCQLNSFKADTKKLLTGSQICGALSSCLNQCNITRDVIETIVINSG